MNRDPIRDADTNSDSWPHAAAMFEPLAATQCYPLVFMTILNYAADVTPTAEIGPLAEGLKFVAVHARQAGNKIDGRECQRGQSISYVPSLSTITAAT